MDTSRVHERLAALFLIHLPRVRHWSEAVLTVGAGNLLGHILSFAAGILILRSLPTDQYALYTMAYAMLGTVSLLGDCGINMAMTAAGGKVWQDRTKLGIVMATGGKLRWRFAVVILLTAPPLLLLLMRRHGAGWTDAVLLIGCVTLLFLAGLQSGFFGLPLQLHQRNGILQRIGIVQGAGRLALLAATLFWLPLAAVAMATAIVTQTWAAWRLRQGAEEFADFSQREDRGIHRALGRTVRLMLPGAVYYALSGQLTVWLISFYGSTGAVAEIGALGRLSQLMLLCSSVVGSLIVPRFARLPGEPGLLFRRYFQSLAAIAGVAILIFAAVAAFPQALLFVLGPQYHDLRADLLLLMAGACLNLVGGAAFTLGASRGWIVTPWASISVALATQVVLIGLLDVGTVSGCLWLALLGGLPPYALCVAYAGIRARRSETGEPPATAAAA